METENFLNYYYFKNKTLHHYTHVSWIKHSVTREATLRRYKPGIDTGKVVAVTHKPFKN